MINTNNIIQDIKIAAALICGLIISVILLQFIIPQGPRHPSNLAVRVAVAQTNDKLLSLQSMDLQKIPPQQYLLSYRHNYYTVKILDAQNKELFTGEVLNQYIIPPDDYGPAVLEVKTPNNLTLYLPYFKNAKKIVFLDESGVIKLEVAVNNLSVPEK